MVLDGTSPQEYPVKAGFLQGSIISAILFLLYIYDLPGEVICILLSILKILTCDLSSIRYLIYCNNQSWLLNLTLTYKTLWTVTGSCLLISMLEKLNMLHLTGLITLVVLILKWMDHLLIC